MDNTATATTPQLTTQDKSPSGLWQRMVANRLLLAAAAIVLVGLGLRLLTFDRYLPYMDHTDESAYYTIALSWRGAEDHSYLYWRYGNLPPFYLHLNSAVQMLVDAVTTNDWLIASKYIYVLRLMSAFVGTFTIIAIMGLVRLVANGWVGLLAGAVWAFAPVIVEFNSLAIPDPYVYCFTALLLFCTIKAWQQGSPRWLLGSLIFGILAILAKYWFITAVLPFVLIALWLTYRSPRKMLPWMVLYAVIALVSMAYLFLVVRPLDIPAREVDTFKESGLAFAFSLDRNLNNWWHAVYPLTNRVFYPVIFGGLLAFAVSKTRGLQVVNWRYAAFLIVFTIPTMLMVASFSNVWLDSIGKIRHTLPTTIVVLSLWGMALAQIYYTLRALFASQEKSSLWRSALPVLPVVLILLLLTPDYVRGNVAVVEKFQRTHVMVLFWRWADVNVPLEGKVVMHQLGLMENTWNRPWSGYDGDHTFEWWHINEETLTQHTPAEYVAMDMVYFTASEGDMQTAYASDALQNYIADLTLVKTIPAPPETVAGETVYFYRMLPPQVNVDVDYGGEIRMVGYDSNTDSALKPGDSITFRPYWRTDNAPSANYSMFIHLYPDDHREVLSQRDGPPAAADRPTLTWDDAEELYFGSPAVVPIPADLSPGTYRLAVGLYDYTNGVRLTLPDGADFYSIPLTIEAPGT